MTIGDIAAVALATASTISLLYIGRQVTVTRLQTKGQFLLALDEQFERSTDMMLRVISDPSYKPTGSEWPEVWKEMSVFERINIMVEDKILDIRIIDRLYGYRLMSLIANEEIYRQLESAGAEWQDFIDLCYVLARRRQRRSKHPEDLAFVQRVRKLSKETRPLASPFRVWAQ